MSAGNLYTVLDALERENDTTASDTADHESKPTAQEVVEGMTIVEAREALAMADNTIRAAEANKQRAIKAKAFIKAQLFREVE